MRGGGHLYPLPCARHARGHAPSQAMLFALLGALCLCGEPGNVPSCTGADGPAQLGKVCPSRNWDALVAKLAAGLANA